MNSHTVAYPSTSTESQAERDRREALRVELEPFMEPARQYVRSLGYNRVEKRDARSLLLNRNLPSAFDSGITPEEKTARRNRWLENYARYEAFQELEKECHLTPERRAQLQQKAIEKRAAWARYAFAADLAANIESDRGLEQSQTARLMAEFAKERLAEVAEPLAYALTQDDIELLHSINSSRRNRRFRVIRTRGSEEFTLPDVELKVPYCYANFVRIAEHARTLADLKQICAMWAAPCRVERREEGSVVIGDCFEIVPAN